MGLAALVLAACGEERLLESHSELVDDLVVTFHLEPDTARADQRIRALLTISNPGPEAVTLESVEGCPARLSVQDPAGAPIPFSGADTCEIFSYELGWLAADTSAIIELVPDDDPLRARWELTAAVEDASSPGSTHPPAPGLYTVRLVTPSPFPTLETHLSVLAPQPEAGAARMERGR